MVLGNRHAGLHECTKEFGRPDWKYPFGLGYGWDIKFVSEHFDGERLRWMEDTAPWAGYWLCLTKTTQRISKSKEAPQKKMELLLLLPATSDWENSVGQEGDKGCGECKRGLNHVWFSSRMSVIWTGFFSSFVALSSFPWMSWSWRIHLANLQQTEFSAWMLFYQFYDN